jgi:DNA-binding LacI/PurR family transcriptional regulator
MVQEAQETQGARTGRRALSARREEVGDSLYRDLLRHAQTAGADEKIAAERDLARMYGICRVTVRKVIGGLVKEGRLRQVQGRGTFVAAPGHALRVRQVILADSFADIAHPYAASLLAGVLHQAGQGIRMQTTHFHGSLLDPDNSVLLTGILRPETEGLIVSYLSTETYGALKQGNPALRIVCTTKGIQARDVACVTWDRFDCGMQAVNFLIGRRARNLLAVSPPGGKPLILEGARYAARAGGVRVEEIDGSREDSATARAVLDASPDGLFFTDDLYGRNVLRRLEALRPGLVGETPMVAVTNTGLDILPHGTARLEVNGYEVGATAMTMLKMMLDGAPVPNANIRIKARLVEPGGDTAMDMTSIGVSAP